MAAAGRQGRARSGHRRRLGAPAALLGLFALALPFALEASAQNAAEAPPDLSAALTGADAPLYLEADNLVYDFDRDVVSAVGNVTIYFRGYQLTAGAVTLDRQNGTFTATRGARLEEPDGTIVTAERITLSEDLAQGFAEGIRVDTIVRSRFAAQSAERVDGNRTVFNNGVYTACERCLARPDEPPTWQIKARTIIHDETERTVRYDDATFELWGIPIAYLPFFAHPDPTVRRKSGFLVPEVIYSNLLGFGVRVPYFWAISPSYDLTLAATPLTRQGLLVDAEWRQQLLNGAYDIRVAGIFQADPGAFAPTTGDRPFRGSVTSSGDFDINEDWRWGWNAVATTDRVFLEDYSQPNGTGDTGVNDLFLTGLGDSNYFDLRGYFFRILRDDFTGGDVLNPPAPFTPVGQDLQGKQPLVHPALNYDAVLDQPVLGGELNYAVNVTSLTRWETDAFGFVEDDTLTAGFRGVEGTFSRASAALDWRRQFIDPLGQVYTPFAGAQADVFFLDNQDAAVTALDDGAIGRALPWVGVQYRWPWAVTSNFGSQIVEPIAQVVARTDESNIGDIANEDSQSVIFEDTSLFDLNRFSGFDRSAGGTRLDLGLRYSIQAFNGGFLSALFGQSYQLAGRNSYATPDILNSSIDSGLETDQSDYVAGLFLASNAGFKMSAQGRFDQETFDIEQGTVQAGGQAGAVTATAAYAFLTSQPALGAPEDRQEVQGGASVRLLDTLRLFGQIRYDIENRDVIREGIGVGYDDDSISMSLSFAEDRSGDDADPIDRTVFFRVGLRTLGEAGVSGGFGE